MLLQRLNTSSFLDIVDFYELNNVILFYKLFYKENINGFYGFEHIKRMMCTLQYIFKYDKDFSELTFNECKDILTASVFHNFDFVIPKRDNTKTACNAYISYCRKLDKEPNKTVLRLIEVTEFAHNEEKRRYYPDYFNLFIDADLSMVLFNDFTYHYLMGYLFDYKCELNKNEFISSLKKYVDNIMFYTKFLSELWEREKEDIVDECVEFIDSKTLSIRFESLAKDYLNYRTRYFEDSEQYNFEIIQR